MSALVTELIHHKDEEVLTLVLNLGINRKLNESTIKHFSKEIEQLRFRRTAILVQSRLIEKLLLACNGIANSVRDSVAIFTASDFVKIVPLRCEVRSRVVLDTGFALSELLFSENNCRRHHILVFGGSSLRLLEGTGESCSELIEYQPSGAY